MLSTYSDGTLINGYINYLKRHNSTCILQIYFKIVYHDNSIENKELVVKRNSDDDNISIILNYVDDPILMDYINIVDAANKEELDTLIVCIFTTVCDPVKLYKYIFNNFKGSNIIIVSDIAFTLDNEYLCNDFNPRPTINEWNFDFLNHLETSFIEKDKLTDIYMLKYFKL